MAASRSKRSRTARRRSGPRQPPGAGPPHDPAGFPVVGIGASAGGLDACRKLLDALPAGNGMAFILILHLDPTHESMMVDLLAGHTSMTVCQATDGMLLEREHLYVIPPGAYLAVGHGALHLSQPQARHGARLPFDFLLHSLAQECGARAICVTLSGTGADGSLGLKAVKENGGLVIAQDPGEAGFDGMPTSAITTGAVDLVLPVAEIAEALATFPAVRIGARPKDRSGDALGEIIDLLRARTVHDFRRYKRGTLQRRIERRMALAAIKIDDKDRYLDLLRRDASEVDLLAKDLLINVTKFFRDPKVFDFLAETIVPGLVRNRTPGQPLRIWIAGCSTGEETYSLAMLFREAITAAKLDIKLQVFASDVDPDAVALAREGVYPEAIEADVSPARLARFLTKEDHGYRVTPELRASVVFTVQDVLADPPFSRLDLISCRNLLIYLRPEAQEKVISLFHFALREDGLLLLGNSETVGKPNGRFKVISKSARLYRHTGHRRPGELARSMSASDGVRTSTRPGPIQPPSRQAILGDLCRRLVLDTYAPAAVLINSKYECLYSLGPTDRYLHVPPGHPTQDLLAMARQNVRLRLRSAIQQASRENAHIVVAGGRLSHAGHAAGWRIAVQPVLYEGEQLLLVSFIDEPQEQQRRGRPAPSRHGQHADEVERELAATRSELQEAIRALEIGTEEQKASNEEALSINEEYQSTNEELLTSKEELQSLNEELTALNAQLQETLERQRTTSNDLQNVLYSTDVATLFLDTSFNIRFFTPATKSLFHVLPSDVGRPLADLSSLVGDGALLTDAQAVLTYLVPIEREVETPSAWYIRRVTPYRTDDNRVDGVVITFADITERRHAADALEVAKRQAEQANAAKSRFLAAASHDLRQPLQTLSLLQERLTQAVEGEKAQTLVDRLGDALGAISGMLNALLDITQIEAGTVGVHKADFPINDLLDRLRTEFTYHAQAKGLALRVVSCDLTVHSDPRLLEQMIRNLLSNALKYTAHGRVLLGCRRHNGVLSIEVWDTGVGIPHGEMQTIFQEYRQLENPTRERNRGLGLGLAIVRHLGILLGHPVRVRSQLGKGSVFTIETGLPVGAAAPQPEHRPQDVAERTAPRVRRSAAILVVEDNPEVRELLELLLKDEGHDTIAVPDGILALEVVQRAAIRPDLIVADYKLPNGLNGLEVTTKLRERLNRQIPAVILTGDAAGATFREIALQHCVQLTKPVRMNELTDVIERLLPAMASPVGSDPPDSAGAAGSSEPPVVFVVDDDSHVRQDIRAALEENGCAVEDYGSSEAFLEAYRPGRRACLLIDAYLPGLSGLQLLDQLERTGDRLPAIMITGNSDVSMAVQAMKAGASDFIEKPISNSELLASVARALEQSRQGADSAARRTDAMSHLAHLTPRQGEIMERVLAGHSNKHIAADLGISQRTVENHRASIMKRTGSTSLPGLARLALTANRSAKR